jgi:hypothetical protein
LRNYGNTINLSSVVGGTFNESSISKGFRTVILNSSLNAQSFYESHGYHVIRQGTFPLSNQLKMGSLEMEKELIK